MLSDELAQMKNKFFECYLDDVIQEISEDEFAKAYAQEEMMNAQYVDYEKELFI